MLGSDQPHVCSSWLVSGTRGSLAALLPPLLLLLSGGTVFNHPLGVPHRRGRAFLSSSPPRPSARAVIPSHFLPQEDVSKAEEMFPNKTGEP